MSRSGRWLLGVCLVAILATSTPLPPAWGQNGRVTREEVEKAIRDAIKFLQREQRNDGSWPDADNRAHAGTTALVTLALLNAGERPNEPHVAKALANLEQFTASDLGRTYTVALQSMVFAAADPERYKVRLVSNVAWLEKAQLRPGDRHEWPPFR